MNRRWIPLLTVLAVFALAGAVAMATVGTNVAGRGLGSERAGEAEGGHSDPDAGAAVDEARIRAFQTASDAGTAGVPGPVEHLATPGWEQATPFSKTQDEWEPAVAADPGSPKVYLLA